MYTYLHPLRGEMAKMKVSVLQENSKHRHHHKVDPADNGSVVFILILCMAISLIAILKGFDSNGFWVFEMILVASLLKGKNKGVLDVLGKRFLKIINK